MDYYGTSTCINIKKSNRRNILISTKDNKYSSIK